jgi:hypothetical protein
MGKIKSALEIALERTESVTSNKDSIGQFKAKQKGKRLANDFLKGTAVSLEEELEKASGDELASLKLGIFDILISQITLPAIKEDLKRVEAAGQGLHTIIGSKRFGEIVKQMSQMLNQYLDEAAHYEEAIKKQYAPKLRHKEEEISRRVGRHIKLDPFQDPEFVAFFNQNMNTLKANYEGTIGQVKEEARKLFDNLGH